MANNEDRFWNKYKDLISYDSRQLITLLIQQNPNNRLTIDKIECGKWYQDYSYDLPHVLKYQVLSLFRNIKKKQFDEKFNVTNTKVQAEKDSLLATHVSTILESIGTTTTSI